MKKRVELANLPLWLILACSAGSAALLGGALVRRLTGRGVFQPHDLDIVIGYKALNELIEDGTLVDTVANGEPSVREGSAFVYTDGDGVQTKVDVISCCLNDEVRSAAAEWANRFDLTVLQCYYIGGFVCTLNEDTFPHLEQARAVVVNSPAVVWKRQWRRGKYMILFDEIPSREEALVPVREQDLNGHPLPPGFCLAEGDLLAWEGAPIDDPLTETKSKS